MYNAKAMAAAANVDPSTVTDADLDFVNSFTESSPRTSTGPTSPSQPNRWRPWRISCAGSSRALEFLELDTLSDSEVDTVCAVVAPMPVDGIGVIREQIRRPGLHVLAPVLSFMESERALSA